MTKEMTLRMPDEIHDLLVSIREHFRISVNAKVMDYVARGLVRDGYFPVSRLLPNSTHNDIPKDIKLIPEPNNVMYNIAKKRLLVK